MAGASNKNGTINKGLLIRFAIMIAASASIFIWTRWIGLNQQQSVSVSVFLAIVLGTLLFWDFRLAVAFIGLSVLIFTNSLTIEGFITSASLEVIMFLVGMMIVVGALRDLGFFTWVVQGIVSIPNMTGSRFIVITAATSALLACAVDEVTSIIFISTLVFQVCNRLKLNPVPYIVICVLSTNVGSAGTMMGNPVGIFIGTRAGLTFEDFITWAFPVMLVALGATIWLTMLWFRKDIALFSERLKERMDRNLSLVPVVKVPYKRGLILLGATLLLIASHNQLETLFGLEKNSILLIAPLVCAGVVMIYRREHAREYVEKDVDWWTLLFFMLLFAIAGTLEHSGVTKVLATGVADKFGTEMNVLVPSIMVISGLGSAFVDNVIFVAAFAPVIEELGTTAPVMPLWWALLFGGCIGGNITMIGSTANIVAIGMLEKKFNTGVRFFEWIKIGAISALVAGSIAAVLVTFLSRFMPDM